MNLFKRTKEDPYDFILGQNFLQNVKLDIKSSTYTFAWDKIEIPMSQEDIGTKLVLRNSGRLT